MLGPWQRRSGWVFTPLNCVSCTPVRHLPLTYSDAAKD